MKRAQPAELAGADNFAHGANMRPEALGVAAEQFDFVLDRGFDHLFRFGQRDRHGFFDDNVFAGVGGDDRVGGVKAIRRRHPDRFDIGIGAHFFNAVVGLGAVTLAEGFKHPRVDVGGGGELEFRYLFHGRQDFRGADADADDAEL